MGGLLLVALLVGGGWGCGKKPLAAPNELPALRLRTEHQPNTPDAWVALGKAYFAQKRYNDAFITYRRAIELDAKSFEALYGLGECCYFLSDPQSGMEWAVKALARRPNSPAALGLRGRLKLAQSDVAGALPDMEKAVAQDPAQLETRLALVTVYRMQKRSDLALGQAVKMVQQYPQEGRAHYVCGSLLEEKGETAAAEAEYRGALKCDGKLVRAKYALAHLLVRESHGLDEASRLAAEVAAEAEGDGTPAGLAAWALFRSGKQDEGLQALGRAYDQHKDNLQILVWINQAATQMGKVELANASAEAIRTLTTRRQAAGRSSSSTG
jgi:cytochrome c-type biogenesis protein CcmH/NrfG